MLDYTLCNELLAAEGLGLTEQAHIARKLGYAGLEIAPGTLGPEPHLLGAEDARRIRETVAAEGIGITGLHWLLVPYPEASITEPAARGETQDILIGLVDLCAQLGGRVCVHGSPKQRQRADGMSDAMLMDYLAEFFAPIASHAEAQGVTYCIEPLSTAETDVITTVLQGAELVRAVGSPAFRTMIDISAAGQVEPPVADLIRDWVPSGLLGHIHANDSNRGAPGMGDDPFHQIVAAIRETGWAHPVGIEPFRTLIDAKVTSATAIATLRACERATA
ncbi:sugar phosphate isomerase/epimerase family protein [Amaricoccus macauensis]|uniref:sugar phosphate isomerase/epimerase family protein n=1 Tax=Amaricoccus macauensis TaxID=57001 RepID=UPI003C7DEA83